MGGAGLLFYVLRNLALCLKCRALRGLCRGSRWIPALGSDNVLRIPVELVALGGCCYGYIYFVHWFAVEEYCLRADRHNWVLLLFSGLLLNTFVLQLLVTLDDAPSRHALTKSDDGQPRAGCAWRLLAQCKLAIIDLADFYYYVCDALICSGLLLSLYLLSLLPLLSLQDTVLFRSRDFARVIDKKLRHADLLERILS